MHPSREELLDTVRRYYDADTSSHFTTATSPQAARRHERWARWTADLRDWDALRDELSRELPGYLTGELYPTTDGGPRCLVYPPEGAVEWVVVGCVSLLAPVYFIYGVQYTHEEGGPRTPHVRFEPAPAPMAHPARILARAIETRWGYSALPRELAETPVPLVTGWREPPETTLFHALFTNTPDNLP
ncbi:hypothetical protein [Melittangium boletus]|uniref:hypothetical protein n=1 Tax=Melittangium boletus TaxID=83453 RepID=UPI003DA31527